MGTQIVAEYPHEVIEQPTVWIPISDGIELAARIWRPAVSGHSAVPAILELIPYRRRDGTLWVDERIHPFYAGHGFASVRVDLRGSGDSGGLLQDEYLPREQDDAIEIIAWLRQQPWCDGNIGMTGLSWGGFNSLQVAARAPKQLKAVVAVGATVDRYNDDVHYKNGCLLNENFVWGTTLMSFQARPPDPDIVGDRWRSMWLKRLEGLAFYPENWLTHQLRDDYWRHGSVCEDYGAIQAAVMIITGWADLYVNAIPKLLTNLSTPCRAIAGPWGHQFPHLATPGPAGDYLHEALRWWRKWLAGSSDVVEATPSYLAYIQEGGLPDPFAQEVKGTWIEQADWPNEKADCRTYYLCSQGLSPSKQAAPELSIRSPLDTGTASGEWIPHCYGPEMPQDQRGDDIHSLTFDSELLTESLDILGNPIIELTLLSDHGSGNLIVRLCDVAPAGESSRVCLGALNLKQRHGNDGVEPVPIEASFSVRLVLDHVGHRFPRGHRIRVAISTAYWPLIWPAVDNPTLTLVAEPARLVLPILRIAEADEVIKNSASIPAAGDICLLRQPKNTRTVERDLAGGTTRLDIVDDFGEQEFPHNELIISTIKRERYTIQADDPLSATCEVHWRQELRRGEWKVNTETEAAMSCDADYYHLNAQVTASEGERCVMQRDFQRSIARLL